SGKVCGGPARAGPTVSAAPSGAGLHGTGISWLHHAIARDNPIVLNTSRQKWVSSATRPRSGNRLVSKKRKRPPCSCSHCVQRFRVRYAGVGPATEDVGEADPITGLSPTCCSSQLYQRRGAMHSGSREQVRRQTEQ